MELKKRGGYRENAKRPLKFGTLKTERINILIPADFKKEIKEKFNLILSEYGRL